MRLSGDDAALARLSAAVGGQRLRADQRHSHHAGKSLETGHRTVQQVSQISIASSTFFYF